MLFLLCLKSIFRSKTKLEALPLNASPQLRACADVLVVFTRRRVNIASYFPRM